MKRCAARPRCAARGCVLSRPDSAAIGAPGVLASHHPSHPGDEPSFCWSLLAQALIRNGACYLAAPNLPARRLRDAPGVDEENAVDGDASEPEGVAHTLAE